MNTHVIKCLHCNTPVKDINCLRTEPEKYPCRHILVPLEPGVMEQCYFCSELCFDCYDTYDEEEYDEEEDVYDEETALY